MIRWTLLFVGSHWRGQTWYSGQFHQLLCGWYSCWDWHCSCLSERQL